MVSASGKDEKKDVDVKRYLMNMRIIKYRKLPIWGDNIISKTDLRSSRIYSDSEVVVKDEGVYFIIGLFKFTLKCYVTM